MPRHAIPSGRQCSHRRYFLDCADYDALVEHAADCCQICGRAGKETGHGYLVIDHDATLGNWAVRGLLCSSCNLQIEHGRVDSGAYLASPWHARYGLTYKPEPELGSVIRAGRRRFQRTSTGWESRDGYGAARLSWETLLRRYGPRTLICRSDSTEQCQ